MTKLERGRGWAGLWQPDIGYFWGLSWEFGQLEVFLARARLWIGLHKRLRFGVTTYAYPRQHIYDIGPLRLAWAWHARRRNPGDSPRGLEEA